MVSVLGSHVKELAVLACKPLRGEMGKIDGALSKTEY